MSRRRKQPSRRSTWNPQPNGNTNPRRLGGGIAGPGGPHDPGAVVIDMTDCVLLDATDICVVDQITAGERQGPAIYLTMQGRINNRTERAQIGYVFGSDGAAAMICQLLSLAHRAGPGLLGPLVSRLVELESEGVASLDGLLMALFTAKGSIASERAEGTESPG